MGFWDVYSTAGLAILALAVALWLISLAKRDASVIDPVWSLFFLTAAVIAYFWREAAAAPRQTLLLALVGLWALRLSSYLIWRNWGEGEDYRYREWREQHGAAWRWRSLISVFLLQAALAWIISVPLVAALQGETTAGLGWLDGLGALIWAVGFFFETTGDWQLARFKADPANKGQVLQHGVWRYTRHPNYFGDAAQWWGFYLIAAAAGAAWTVYAPILMTFLLIKVSGVALLEQSLEKKKPKYWDYIERTPAFVPWFPKKRKG